MTAIAAVFFATAMGATPAAPVTPPARLVAVTFDDLPAAGTTNPDERASLSSKDIRALNSEILRILKKHHAPAIGFVNEKGIAEAPNGEDRRDILQAWLANGMQLGNHTYSHADFNQLSAIEFEKEIANGEALLRPLVEAAGQSLDYFRFPFNHTGDTQERREAVSRYLTQHGYRLATCTIDNEDFMFERAYRLMLQGHDVGNAEKLKAAYLTYTAEEIDYYAALHKQVFGRESPQVMLLHANRLNAALLDGVLSLFVQRGYRFVTLSEAQSDPAFRTPDTFTTKFGPMWGYRWARALGVKVDGSRQREPPEWIVRYGRSK